MSVKRLDHVNIRTSCYDETIAFYRDMLGLDPRPTPRGDMSKSAWLYDDEENPAVHVGRAEAAYPADAALGRTGSGTGSGSLDHVALECSDEARFRERLQAGAHPFHTNVVAEIGLRQLFVRDPNGIMLELNFRSA